MSWEKTKHYSIKRPGIAPLEFEGRLFCETDLAGAYSVRLFVTRQSRVLLICTANSPELRVVTSEHDTLEDAANELAASPQELVPNSVYNAFLESLDSRSRRRE